VVATDARSRLMGRIVDGYTNITTLKLFAHSQHEETYARDAMADQTDKVRQAGRMVSAMDVTVTTLNGLLIAGTTGIALWLWNQGLVTTGAIALSTGLVIRINNMSGWIMWVVNGIFENVGQVQDGMKTIAVPRRVLDRPDAQPLDIRQGEVRFDHVGFHYGKGSGVIDNEPRGAAWREDRTGRSVWRGQVDARQPAATALRRGDRPHPDRRPGHCWRDAGEPARADRHGHAGHITATPLDSRQPALRQARQHRGRVARGLRRPAPTTSWTCWSTRTAITGWMRWSGSAA
jgi:ABC-type multidrug transport system fused ATPase/permease subunit